WVLEKGEGLATVRGLLHGPLLVLEPSAQALALVRVVLHQQDPRRSCRSPKTADHAMEPLAVDGLGEIARRAERNPATVLVQDGDHDDRDLGELGILA